MERIIGCQNGRIFMCGRDGCIYEIDYSGETSSWWGLGYVEQPRKVRKVNHSSHPLTSYIPSFLRWSSNHTLIDACYDSSRNILFTLSNNSIIQVFDLGDGSQMKFVVAKTDLIKDARNKYQALQKYEEKILKIIRIYPIQSSESEQLNLVAICRCGIRLYLSTVRTSRYSMYSSRRRPQGLYLQHIRIPPSRRNPGILAAGQTGPLGGAETGLSTTDIHTALYSGGVFMFADQLTPTQDAVVAVSPSVSHNLSVGGQSSTFEVSVSTRFKELFQNISFGEGRTWEIHEMPLELAGVDASMLVNKSISNNELAFQHLRVERKFLLLTSHGIHIVAKSRPVDDLERLLTQNGPESQAVHQFAEQFGVDEFCAMCLILATRETAGATSSALGGRRVDQLQLMATTAFFTHAGRPHFESSEIASEKAAAGVETVARGIPPSSQKTIIYSGSHNGMAMYLGRLLYPLWTESIVVAKKEEKLVKGKKTTVTRYYPTFSKEQFSRVERRLENLEQFLTRNQFAPMSDVGVAPYSGGPQSVSKTAMHYQRRRLTDEAHKIEANSLSNLHQLLAFSIESLSFFRILYDYDLPAIIAALPAIAQTKFAGMRFNTFTASSDGVNMASDLVNALISIHTTEGDSVHQKLGKDLRIRCPSLFSEEDSLRFLGFEALTRAKTATYREVQLGLLQDSLRYFRQIPKHVVDLNILQLICGEYHYLRYYQGVLELCLACAHAVDPSGVSLRWVLSGHNLNDTHKKSLFDTRRSCYQPFTHSLTEFSLGGPSATTPLVDPRTGEVLPRPSITSEEEKNLKERVLDACKKSTDELFHYTLYQWWLDQGLDSELLGIETEFVEKFLKTLCKPEEKAFGLLWRYYNKKEDFSSATVVLTNLAERKDVNVDLSSRLEFLSRAVIAGKAALTKFQSSVSRPRAFAVKKHITGEELQQLEEKLEVAKVQAIVLKEIGNIVIKHEREEAERLLNSSLYTVNDLYNKFAAKYGLTMSALHLFATAGFHAPHQTYAIWDEIFSDCLEDAQNDGFHSLKVKVTAIGREFYPNDNVFSLAYLIPKLEATRLDFTNLESRAGSDASSPYWVIELFLNVGVSLEILFREYRMLVQSQEARWRAHQIPLFLVFYTIIDMWLNHLEGGSPFPHDIQSFRENDVGATVDEIRARLESLRGPNAVELRDQYESLRQRILNSQVISSRYTEYH
eukprot:TRINITY_DN2033_c0_g1_i1.p1 TRINITY_DN2033_c0_g1~~TRINITY_DN2033_c0_g1_i1.p1  ORF type:complete len:1386 (-),score=323.26 TRINITY_DN2033_c0_g1_i1:46-3639(-)